MLVTVIADASYCHTTGAAGYGVWVACERGKRAFEGPFSKPANSSFEAEMMAIVNGLVHAARDRLLLQHDNVIVQTDCIAAIDAFIYGRPKHSQEVLRIANAYLDLISKLNLKVEFRHVKGHTTKSNRPEPRFAANRACDKKAKKHMRIMRNHLQAQKVKDVINAE